jgi:hypothetical protein
MFFQHVYDKTLAQASYFIGCQKAGVAMVIDPKRDVDHTTGHFCFVPRPIRFPKTL